MRANTLLSPLFVLLLLCIPAAAFSQKKNVQKPMLTPEAAETLHAMEDTLAILANAVVNDSIEAERFAACKVLITNLVRALKTPNSFQYPFDRLRSVSILTPPDSTFRIFTWQLFVNDSTYRYYGAIQMNTPELQLFPLIDRSFELSDFPVTDQLTPERWYGALYYSLLPIGNTRQRAYLLFGYDAFTFFEKRKLIEVLSFDPNGKPVFGAQVFNRPDSVRTAAAAGPEMRLILQYSAEAAIKLNWVPQYEKILYDHLIPMPSPFGRGITKVPDGSYEGFNIVKGKLEYVNKVFNDVNPEVPMPEPILDNRKGKDLFGKPKRSRR
ncbi:MAG: hypothetical protein ACR2K1_11785 [Saprospiraceae bacterium]